MSKKISIPLRHLSLSLTLFCTGTFCFSCDGESQVDGEVIYVPSSMTGSDMGDFLDQGEQMNPLDMESPDDLLTLTIRAIDPLSGQGVSGLTLTLAAGEVGDSVEDEQLSTDQSGTASIRLAPLSDYEVIINGEGYSAHHLFGSLGESDATQISFVSPDTLTAQVFSALGTSPDPTKGIVVIGLDQPNLAPAVGTRADLSSDYEKSFTLGSFGPSEGNEVISGGGGFVSFANVSPGEAIVSVEPKMAERCAVFPRNESSEYTLPVYAGEVSVMAFICQPLP